jgi:hypothetical protein
VTEPGLPELRISDAERDAASTELARHRAEGRLTLDEFSERVDLVYAAKTGVELEVLRRDLPAVAADERHRKPTRWLISIMGGSRRAGRWRIEGKTRAVAIMGGCNLDLRSAEIPGAEALITCFAWMGGVRIVVPEGVEVDVTGFTIIGGRDIHVKAERPRPGTPLIRIRAFSVMGGVVVQTPEKPLPN